MKERDISGVTRSLMKKHGLEADTSLDQHFMVNLRCLETMMNEADLKHDDVVLEIGAGLGILTNMMAGSGAKVVSFEIDKRLQPLLRSEVRGKNVNLFFRNGLEAVKLGDVEFNKIVCNIPYAICEPLLAELERIDFDLALVTVPEKFHKRIWTDRTMLSFRTRCFFRVEVVMKLERSDFFPEPGTDSVLIKITRLSPEDYRQKPVGFVFRELFLQQTKKLKNALVEAIINLEKLRGRKLTKKGSKATVDLMGLDQALLSRTVDSLKLEDLEHIKTKLGKIIKA
jgi:16S rRNA (adenine1518-N6/adenine1519-N6)-dimethyltransferase